MLSKCEILFLKASKDPPIKLFEVLQNRGYKTRVTKNLYQLTELVKEMANPIIVAFSENNREETQDQVHKLITFGKVDQVPLLVIGKDADSFRSELLQKFENVDTLNSPCHIPKIIEAILNYDSLYDSGALEVDRTNVQNTKVVEPPVEQLPEKTKIKEGGERFVSFKFTEFPEELLPQNPGLASHCKQLFDTSPKKLQNHIVRVSFVSNEISQNMGLSSNDTAVLKTTAVLMNLGFQGKDTPLLFIDYTRNNQEDLRYKICSRLKDSAINVATEIKAHEVSSTLVLLAKAIGGEGLPSHTSEGNIASILAASDLVGRCCCNKGYWDPRQANRLIHHLPKLVGTLISPLIEDALLKFLASASSSSGSRQFLLPNKFRDRSYIDTNPITQLEKVVQVNDLSPGMKLSRKMYTSDGKLLLDSDLTLDKDLIRRIWRLSGVRPVDSATVLN